MNIPIPIEVRVFEFVKNQPKGATITQTAKALKMSPNVVKKAALNMVEFGRLEFGKWNRLILTEEVKEAIKEIENKPEPASKICKHCGKGKRHWSDWDDPRADCEGNGACKSARVYGGCVGEWSCNIEEMEERKAKEDKKHHIYGGRLGYIISIYPRVHCPICQTPQVQLTDYCIGDPKYKCRHCKQVFTLPYIEPKQESITP